MRNLHRVTTAALAAVLTFAMFTACGDPDPAPPEPTKDARRVSWTEPYGGCKEAYRYPGTPGYRACVRHGVLSQDQSNRGGGTSW